MPRKPVARSLPSLAQLHAKPSDVARGVNQAAALLGALRDIAQRVRPKDPVPFYSMLGVAGFFGVSYRTVARAYARLEGEGLLRRIRGSQTLVLPQKRQPVHHVRGVIGVPIWMPGFLTFGDWRAFFISLEEELRKRHYVADLIFYRQGEDEKPGFPDRVLAHHPDHIIWFCPDATDRRPMELLKDSGVQVTVIADRPAEFPARIYRLSWEAGLETGLREWMANGVTHVQIPITYGVKRPATSCTHVLAGLLQRLRVGHSFPAPDSMNEGRAEYVATLGRDAHVGVIFDEDSWYEALCSSATQAMLDLFRNARVMVMRSVVFHGLRLDNAFVDALCLDWREIAGRIAQDLDERTSAEPIAARTFHARWCPRLPLDQIAQSFRWQ